MICHTCQTKIPEKRLAAMPNARFCLQCQPAIPVEIAVPGVVDAIALPGEQDGQRPPAFEPLRPYPGHLCTDERRVVARGTGE